MAQAAQAITIQEFASRLSISTASVRRMIERGQLRAIKILGLTSVRIPVSEVSRLLGDVSGEQKGSAATTDDPQTTGVHSGAEMAQ